MTSPVTSEATCSHVRGKLLPDGSRSFQGLTGPTALSSQLPHGPLTARFSRANPTPMHMVFQEPIPTHTALVNNLVFLRPLTSILNL